VRVYRRGGRSVRDLRFGVLLPAARFPGRSDGEVLAGTVRAAAEAERAGFDDVRFAEHRFMSYGVCPSAMTLAAHTLGRTTRIDVGTAVSVLSTQHPVAPAERAALLDHLSDGRFRLGVGRGGPWVDLEVSGTGLGRYETGFAEALDLLLAALRRDAPTIPRQPSSFPDDPNLSGVTVRKVRGGSLSADVTTADNMVYMAGPDVYALDAATGRQRWIYTSASPSRQERTFLLNGHIAYVLDNPRLVALDSRTGRRLWAVTTPAAGAAPLIAAGGLICMGVADVAGAGLYGWDATSGRLVWNHPTTSTDPTDTWQLDARGSTLAAAHNNALYAFRLNSP
jgi:Luciferase-like monooxygenase/PQQ-like domain